MRSRLVILFGLLILGAASSSTAEPIVFDTSSSRFDQGAKNQGWWSSTVPNDTLNDNYLVGRLDSSRIHRNFFTFDLSSLSLSERTLTAASLELTRFSFAGDATGETYGLFDVSTDAATLNNNNGLNPGIFNDLGSGTSYGTFGVAPYDHSPTETLRFELNQAALRDISAATGGFFSIGGALLSMGGGGQSGREFLMGNSQLFGTQRLVLDVAPVAAPVPEPTSLVLLASATVGLAARRLRHRK